MWELDCEKSWAPKNWCFWTVVLENTLVVPWIARRSNQSILKETSPGSSLEGLMLKLKLQYFGHLMQRVDSLEKTVMLGGIGGRRRRGGQRMRCLDDITEFGWTRGFGDGQGGLVCSDSWGCRVGHDWATELNWTEPVLKKCGCMSSLRTEGEFTWGWPAYSTEVNIFSKCLVSEYWIHQEFINTCYSQRLIFVCFS